MASIGGILYEAPEHFTYITNPIRGAGGFEFDLITFSYATFSAENFGIKIL